MTARRTVLVVALLAISGGALWLAVGVLRSEHEPPRASVRGVAADTTPAPPTFPDPVAARPVGPAIAERPAESAPQSAAPTALVGAAAALQLEIVHANGAPAAGASLVIARDDLVLSHGITDRQGRLQVAALEQPATLYIAGVAPTFHVQPIETGSGRRPIVLPDSAAVSGHVTLQGAAPGEKVVGLGVRSAGALRDEVDLSSAVLGAFPEPFGDWGMRIDMEAQRVSGDGTFAFSGFERGDTVRLLPAEEFMFGDGSRQLEVEAPAAGLVLDLVPGLAVRGRCVWSDTRQPVPKCKVTYRIQSQSGRPSRAAAQDASRATALGGMTTIGNFLFADAEGRFSIAVTDRVVSLKLWLADPDKQALADIVLEGDDIRGGKDLGDVLLRPARTIMFRVFDEQRQPLEGAFATVTRGQELRSRKTGPDGTSTLTGLPPLPVELTFWAVDHEAKRVTSPGPADEQLEVTLERCAALDVRIVAQSGNLPMDLQVCLAAQQQAFTGDEVFGPESMRFELDKASPTEVTVLSNESTTPPTAQGLIYYQVFEDGLVHIGCLQPAVPLTLSVTDGQHARVWGEQIVTLGRGETRVIEAAVPGVAEK